MASGGFQRLFKVSSYFVEATDVVFFLLFMVMWPFKIHIGHGGETSLFAYYIQRYIQEQDGLPEFGGDLHTTYMRTQAVSRKTRSCECLQKAKD